ncbi:hypothetical protein [Amycolatopsis thailandensis]|uniref:hypothetical protein n=1 Tax=Amycolatopsis thailandensis TaxID=589330 RepID=UPI00362C260D
MTHMKRREPTDEDTAWLRETVREVSWQYARRLSGLAYGEPPRSPFDSNVLDEAGEQAAVLAHLAALHDVQTSAEGLIDMTVAVAGETGATAPAIGQALGVTGAAVRKKKKWSDTLDSRPGPKRPARAASGRETWVWDPAQLPTEAPEMRWEPSELARMRDAATDLRKEGVSDDRAREQ